MASNAKTNEQIILEERKVKALEDIDKAEWSERTQWYLYRFHEKFVGNEEEAKK